MRKESLRLNFTKKGIEALTVGKKRVVWHDTHSHGLCLRVEESGRKSFCWFRKVGGRPTWKNIGKFPDLSVENARTKAAEYNSQFARWKADDYQGDDPFERRRDLTLKNALKDYVERWLAKSAKKPAKAIKDANWQFDKYLSSWGNRQLGHIQKRDVLNRHKDIRDTNGLFTANRTVQLLRAVYYWAKNHMDWKGENPASITLFSERQHRRSRFLQADELARLWTALSTEPSRDLQHFVILALFSGARKSDVLSARWENISFEPPVWTIPDPKNKEPYAVPLMAEVVTILQDRQKEAKTEWVFPSRGQTGHLMGFKHSWPLLLTRAKITGLRIHDLRRTLGSWQATTGTSLPIIGKSLGHLSQEATSIYARLQLEPVQESIERATKAMLTAGEKKSG
jgi:integrase